MFGRKGFLSQCVYIVGLDVSSMAFWPSGINIYGPPDCFALIRFSLTRCTYCSSRSAIVLNRDASLVPNTNFILTQLLDIRRCSSTFESRRVYLM